MADNDATRDAGLTALLERVAESGAAAARPAPAAHLRHTAEVRTYRRRLVTAAALVLAVVAGASVLHGPDASRTAPPAGGSATPRPPAPTQLAVSDGAYQQRSLDGSELVDPRAAAVLGPGWSSAGGGADRATLTPCQPAGDSPGGNETIVLTRGTAEQLAHRITAYESEDVARTAYAQAAAWFADCSGGDDQSGAKNSVVRRAAALPPVAGVDDLRILVVRRASTGPDGWTGTVAAVTRVDNLVSVLAWDLTTDDDPPALDDGFVTLTRQAATRLTGGNAASATVPDAALLTPDDPAVRAALGVTPRGTVPALAKVPRLDPLCEVPYDAAAPGTVDTRSPQITGTPPGIVLEFVSRYNSVPTAEAAVASAVTRAESCPADQTAPGQRRDLRLPASGLDDARAWSADLDPSVGVGTSSRQTAVLRRGDLVAYLRIDGFDAGISDEAASAVFAAAAARLASAD